MRVADADGGVPVRLRVLVDQGCPVADSTILQSFSPHRVDVRLEGGVLDAGGVLLLGATLLDGSSSVEELRRLRRRCPHVVVFVCTDWAQASLARAPQFARAGADDLFAVGSAKDVADIGRALTARLRAPPPESALQVLSGFDIPRWPMRVASHLLRNAHHPISISRVASLFGRAVRTLTSDCHRAHLPSPSDVGRVGRWLHLLELSRRGINDSFEQADRLGFSTATDLRQWKWRLRISADRDRRIADLLTELGALANLRCIDPLD